MLLLNEYHEDISKLHVNMMQRRSYYVPFIDTNEAITVKDRNKQNNFFLLNGQWQFNYFDSLQSIKEFENINEIILSDTIELPSVWQVNGYDYNQYTNVNILFLIIHLLFLKTIHVEFIKKNLTLKYFLKNMIII